MPRRVVHGGVRAHVSRFTALGLIAMLAVLFAPIGFTAAAPREQGGVNIRILPINRARLLAGQRFDFRVEVSGALASNSDAGAYTVLINGTPASQVFGKEPTKTNVAVNSAELTWRGVSLNQAGKYDIYVEAGPAKRSVSYEVVRPQANGRPAKNVVLMIADGMSWPSLTIARLTSRGQTEGKYNELLEMDRMEATGYFSTSGYDSIATDSANSAAAFASGQKGVVNAMNIYEDNTTSTEDDPRVEHIVDILKRTRNMAIGIVSTAEIEDATPAAMIAYTRRRSDYQPIIDQMFERKPEVLMGGGAAYFIPKSTAGSRRTDERDVLKQFRDAGYTLVANRAEMNAAGTPERLLGLFHPSNMNVYIDRAQTRDPAVLGPYTDQPSLIEMTQKSLDVLANTPNGRQNGFFLMIEAGSVDKQYHPMDWERGTADLIEFDQSLAVVKGFAAQRSDTLVVVVADHGHSISVYGTYDTTKGPGNPDGIGTYDQARFPTYVDRDGDKFPDSWSPSRTLAVGFANHPEYRDDFLFNPRPLSPTIQDPNAAQGVTRFVPNPARDPQGVLIGANIPRNSGTEVHSVDDTPMFASGPGSAYFRGYHDNTDMFFGMMNALNIDATRNASQPTGSAAGTAIGFVMALSVVVGASRYLRRPGTEGVGPISFMVHKAARFGTALRAAAASFRATLHDDR
ncbi:MAG: alkaline phosphatase [Roseiflexaceae bacterium]|nr:alkaline phosphatase [Roseiflexaceae bacterium]